MNAKEPLGLPRGSVRSILALGTVAAAAGAVFVNTDAADRLLPLATVVTAFYFKSRPDGNGSDA